MGEPAESVVVRMYRGILGDCFLMRVRQANQMRHILIDCGVLQNVAAGPAMLDKLPAPVSEAIGAERLSAVREGTARIREIVDDVVATVDKRIDLVILTHEHYDHLSGFALAADVFRSAEVTIGALWLAWTEDPHDSQARALHARFDKGKQALAMAARLAALGAVRDERLSAAAGLAAFVGPLETGMGAAGVMTGAATIQMLKDKAGEQATRYLEPGQVLEAFGLRAYVLGPPRLESRLTKDKPSGGAAKEVYLTSRDGALAVASTVQARLADAGDDYTESEALAPFARPHLRPLKGGSPKGESIGRAEVRARYETQDEDYRRIDLDWTGAVESLALKMDSDTNNTSLALAFELPDGQVLLFPGDAQVGNWLSWYDQTYGATGEQPITVDDLLRRVTFYKVGHHGSHNATLRQLGLEKMTDTRLTAAIPVVEAVAAVQGPGRATPGKGWKMPYGDLLADLRARTRERIVQGDGDPAREVAAFAKAPTHATAPVVPTYGPDNGWVELAFTPR